MNVVDEQIKTCNKYGAEYVESPFHLKLGISINVKSGIQPVNGLRHPLEGDTTGWYIWAGEEGIPNDPNFFVPLHVEHLPEWCPVVMKYLGLPPGWRFLITNDYEDVWEHKSLLEI